MEIKITGIKRLEQDIKEAEAKTLQGRMAALNQACVDLMSATRESLRTSSLVYWMRRRRP